MNISDKLKEEFKLEKEHVDNVIMLLDEGNTIPFIARYRKELTGHIDDQVLRNFADRLEYLRNLEKRKEDVKKAIEEQGKLTDEIVLALDNAVILTEVEDIYRPYKQKKKTRATVAIAKGLSPLAEAFLEQNPNGEAPEKLAIAYLNEEVKDVKEAILGAQDIIAEIVSDDAELRKKLRKMFFKLGVFYSSFTKKVEEDSEKAGIYQIYKEYSEPITQIKAHRVLALNRGEKDDALKIKLDIDKNLAF
ncbi:MAG: RNA-binding transcriptional accessory protein, partial [Clostridia bacterium]|nr:RNA-binding transcriptional accessory protein [Clostridia bacterium]